ncbi:MAG: putative toxin-antitoxin system toxin component, PIN family [Saprospiraceae bacterium]|nr:putative toxin-antitoxin system toxin component, PIN family [Saprospiraceae bacterium]
MRIVLDTNIILSSVSRYSPHRIVFDKFEQGSYILCLTTEILLEYEEKLTENFNPLLAELTVGAMLLKRNTLFQEVYIRWSLLTKDQDDNKFVDCAVAANADYLVTNDRGFRILKNLPFPKLKIIRIEEFEEILKKRDSLI